MIRKISKVLVASTFLIGLSACGLGNDDVAYDHGSNPQRSLNMGNDGADNQGYYKRNSFNTARVTNDNNHRNDIGNVNISASNTTLSSDKYPHTKAILIQEAKYSFAPVNANELANLQKKIEQELKARFGKLTPQLQQQAQQQAQQQIQQRIVQQPNQNQQQQQPAKQQPAAQQPTQQPKQQTQAPGKQQAQTPAQQQPTKQPAQAPAKQQPSTAGISSTAQEVIRLTNKERTKAGLPALIGDAQLSSVALKKSQDMQANNYFSHTSPTYGSPFDMMRDFGVSYKTAGENIAQGQRTAQEVVQAWMNSEGHRKNIMSKDFTHIGVGHEQSGNHWTQMFIGK